MSFDADLTLSPNGILQFSAGTHCQCAPHKWKGLVPNRTPNRLLETPAALGSPGHPALLTNWLQSWGVPMTLSGLIVHKGASQNSGMRSSYDDKGCRWGTARWRDTWAGAHVQSLVPSPVGLVCHPPAPQCDHQPAASLSSGCPEFILRFRKKFWV